jgi:hypothetical protein
MQPWLLPSLGPTAFLQAAMPAHPSARLYNVVGGHLGGVAAGFVGLWLFNAWNDPIVLQSGQMTEGRLGAAVVALALTMLVGMLLRASHPPAAATTLLVALGSLRTAQQLEALFIGLAILAVVGELIRRIRLGQPSWGRTKAAERARAAG